MFLHLTLKKKKKKNLFGFFSLEKDFKTFFLKFFFFFKGKVLVQIYVRRYQSQICAQIFLGAFEYVDTK